MSNDIKSLNKESKTTKNKKSTIKKNLTFYGNNTLNGFGKMILSNYKTSPNYSFGKKTKNFFYQRINHTPGPGEYNIRKKYVYDDWNSNYKFKTSQRVPINDRKNFNPGIGSYNVSDSYNKLNNKKIGIRIGKEPRFKKDNLDDNLFLPDNY